VEFPLKQIKEVLTFGLVSQLLVTPPIVAADRLTLGYFSAPRRDCKIQFKKLIVSQLLVA
jgi:hypothetical protein